MKDLQILRICVSVILWIGKNGFQTRTLSLNQTKQFILFYKAIKQ